MSHAEARAAALPATHHEDKAARLDELDRLARLLDSQWRVPGTGLTFGVDAVAGLVPGIGDLATGAVSAWIIHTAWRLGATRGVMGRMIANVVLDTAIGAIPLAGSVFDLFFKANNRNMALLRRHLERT